MKMKDLLNHSFRKNLKKIHILLEKSLKKYDLFPLIVKNGDTFPRLLLPPDPLNLSE